MGLKEGMKDGPSDGLVQDQFHERVEILLRQRFDLRPEMLHGGPTGDKPVIALTALSSLQIADTVL